MENIKNVLRRAGHPNTTEHAITQVLLTMVMVVVTAPYGFGMASAILVAIAVLRGVHNV